MTIQNLVEFSEFEESVLLAYSNPEVQARPSLRPTQKPSRMKIMMGVAALAASFAISTPRTNLHTASLSLPAMAIAQSVAEEAPPLEELFANRFDSGWTESMEADLLARVDGRRLSQSRRSSIEQIIDTVFSNQQESLSLEVKRLDRGQVANIVRDRKLV